MTEQRQLIAWRILALVAVALALATLYTFARSQQLPSHEGPSYRIAYTRDLEGMFHIVHCGADGLDCRELAASDGTDLMPSAAPPSAEVSDEPRIAFLRIDTQDAESRDTGPFAPGGVYVLGLNSGQTGKVSAQVDRIMTVRPSWSPDGRQIAFGGAEDLNADGAYALDESGVYVSDVNSGEVRRVATGLLAGWQLSWSPAGDLLLATGIEAGDSVPYVYALEIGSGITYTHPYIGEITTACWSPEGDHIAAYSREDHRIHVLDSQGDEAFAFDAPYGDVLEIIWTPGAAPDASDEQLFAVTGTGFELGAGPLYRRHVSASAGEHWIPVAGAQSFTALLSASPDGRYVAFTRFSSEHEGDLFVLDRADREPRQITSDPGFEGAATWVSVP